MYLKLKVHNLNVAWEILPVLLWSHHTFYNKYARPSATNLYPERPALKTEQPETVVLDQ